MRRIVVSRFDQGEFGHGVPLPERAGIRVRVGGTLHVRWSRLRISLLIYRDRLPFPEICQLLQDLLLENLLEPPKLEPPIILAQPKTTLGSRRLRGTCPRGFSVGG